MPALKRRNAQNARKTSTGITGHVEPENRSGGVTRTVDGHCTMTVREWRALAKAQRTDVKSAILAACVGKWDDEPVTANAAFMTRVEEAAS